ncbi:alpha/beta hydrolase, putative [Plasmodium gallinaceum]|uniref:Alpha/beta hydrolase, putative n=1 Tax=Plasmodium gallinaceum TaxID=5849 RepID=A0A1J1GYV0_PLAGA|nr:alpha/beta hydrolase, putative [Plasmodium gallinaceum]CRG96480.1 alpha/beta hydrolase, putative [Plasmodium gallinaceum]
MSLLIFKFIFLFYYLFFFEGKNIKAIYFKRSLQNNKRSMMRSLYLNLHKINVLKFKNKIKNYEFNTKKYVLLNCSKNFFSTFSLSDDDKEIEHKIDQMSFTIRDNTNIYKEETKNIPILLIHGCYGSKKNFRNFSKMLKSNKIIILDLRNHGDSKHTESMKYVDMETDIKNVLEKLHIKKCCLVGFSLGGKVSMYCALKNPTLFSRLIIMDILPFNYNSNKIHIKQPYNIVQMTNILHKIKKKEPKNKNEFLKYLKEELPDISNTFAQFICMSLKENDKKNQLIWKINVDTIYNELSHIMNFPLNSDNYKYFNPCSFIIGKKSDLVFSIPQFNNIINSFFPNSKQFILENSSHTVYIDEAQKCSNIINNTLCL